MIIILFWYGDDYGSGKLSVFCTGMRGEAPMEKYKASRDQIRSHCTFGPQSIYHIRYIAIDSMKRIITLSDCIAQGLLKNITISHQLFSISRKTLITQKSIPGQTLYLVWIKKIYQTVWERAPGDIRAVGESHICHLSFSPLQNYLWQIIHTCSPCRIITLFIFFFFEKIAIPAKK